MALAAAGLVLHALHTTVGVGGDDRYHRQIVAGYRFKDPAPVVAGSKAAKKDSKSGLIGKTSATARIPSGISLSGMKTPERK